VRAPGLNFPSRNNAAAPNAATVRRDAERAAGKLPPIMVQADRVATTVAQGVHGRRRVGQGDTFWQFRRTQPGDPAHSVDWRQSAKSRFTFVRENEWDAAQSVWIWRDTSASMNYRSMTDLPEKQERVAVLALALASLLVRGGEQVALLGTGAPPSNGRAVINRLAEHIALENDPGPSLPDPEPLPRYGRLVLFGDLLSPVEDIANIVRSFAARGVTGHLVQVLDPAEETLPFRGRVRFEGMEGEGDALIGRVEMVRDDYAALMRAHRSALSDLAQSYGWSFATHHTDNPPETALLALHQHLSEMVD
jgi:uncharacterized protein (DUF58 family)